jgi:integrase/recombinase XerD
VVTIRPLHVSAYIESKPLTAPSVKQHLAALRELFNWLVIKQIVPDNPALFVKGPRFSRRVGITPILEPDQMRKLLNSISVVREVKIPRKHGGGVRVEADVKGLRDRAIIAIMAYTFARVSAVLKLKRGGYSLQGKRARLRLLEKGNKEKLVWLHHEAEEFLDAYLDAANISEAGAAVFQTLDKLHRISGEGISRRDLLCIVKERCAKAELPENICNHTFRGTGITVFLQNGGSLEAAQDMANHSDPRTTKLYDRRKDLATLGEIERRIALIGTTRSRVSFFMNRFRKLGFLEYNGRIRVHKSLLNVILHDHMADHNAVKPHIPHLPRSRSEPARCARR